MAKNPNSPAELFNFEKVLDVLITEGREAARELFHQQIIATGRQINAEILAEDERAMEEELKDLDEDFLEEEVLEMEAEYFSKNEKPAKEVGVEEGEDCDDEDGEDREEVAEVADESEDEEDSEDEDKGEDADEDSEWDQDDSVEDEDGATEEEPAEDDFEARFAALQAEFDALRREVEGESDPLDNDDENMDDMSGEEEVEEPNMGHDEAGLGDMSVVPDQDETMRSGVEEHNEDGDDFSDIDLDEELTEGAEDFVNKVADSKQKNEDTREVGEDAKKLKVDFGSPVAKKGGNTKFDDVSPKMPSDYSKPDPEMPASKKKVTEYKQYINNTSKNKDFMKKVK